MTLADALRRQLAGHPPGARRIGWKIGHDIAEAGGLCPALELVDVARPPGVLSGIVERNVFHCAVAFGSEHDAHGPHARLLIDGHVRDGSRARRRRPHAGHRGAAAWPTSASACSRTTASSRVRCATCRSPPARPPAPRSTSSAR